MDFFTVPTLTYGVLYCFFVIAHDRRRILHCNVTQASDQRLGRFSNCARHFLTTLRPAYLIFDRGTQFNEEVIDTVKIFGIQAQANQLIEVRGRTALPSVGSATAAAICSTM